VLPLDASAQQQLALAVDPVDLDVDGPAIVD
jgi:hypothetical protein